MSEEKKQASPDQAPAETPPPKQEAKTDPAIYTQADVQKMLEKARASEREIAFQDFQKDLEQKRIEREKQEMEQKRNSMIEQINADEKLKDFFSGIDEGYSEKPLDWLTGVMKSHSVQKQDYESRNTAKPAGTGSVAPAKTIDGYWAKRQKALMEQKGVKKW